MHLPVHTTEVNFSEFKAYCHVNLLTLGLNPAQYFLYLKRKSCQLYTDIYSYGLYEMACIPLSRCSSCESTET